MLDHAIHLGKVMLLLGVANGAPIIARKLLGNRLSAPLDGGACWPFDGRRLLGESKTVRGLIASIVATSLAALFLGFDWHMAAGFATAAMAGDALSSFVKRRLGRMVHSQFLGLDQIPESLLPLLLFRDSLGLGGLDLLPLVALFLVLELWLSRLLFRLNIRDRPY